jgi:hypothetical protein
MRTALRQDETVYALRRFTNDGLRVPAVYKLPPALITSADDNAKG